MIIAIETEMKSTIKLEAIKHSMGYSYFHLTTEKEGIKMLTSLSKYEAEKLIDSLSLIIEH